MRLIFAGTPELALPTLRALMQQHELVAIISQPPAARGRSKQLIPSPVAAFALANGLPLLTPEKIGQIAAELRDLQADLAVVVAYGQLLPAEVLSATRLGWINLHFSLLPAWRGAAPVQRAVIAGDDVTGATVFQLDEGMDSGPVLGSLTVGIGETETSGELLARLAELGSELVVQSVAGLAAGAIRPMAQLAADASYASKLLPADAQVNWAHPALAIARLIRGCTPEPGAWTTAAGERLLLAPVEFSPELALAPGKLQIEKREVLVGTGSHAVRLGMVKPAGKNWMPAVDWARGLRTHLESLGDAG